jgi:hypothetical protein
MKVEIDVKELIVEGLPATDRADFARRLEHELSRRLGPDVPEAGTRAMREVRVERSRPLTSASDAAADVARVVQRRIRK